MARFARRASQRTAATFPGARLLTAATTIASPRARPLQLLRVERMRDCAPNFEDLVSCCEPIQLCDACFGVARERLIRDAEGAGEQLARELLRSIVPEPKWVRALDEQSPVVTKRIAHLTQDPRLAQLLARACITTLRRTLLEPPRES